MSIRSFLKLVEIQTKIASVFPFFIGILFVLYRYDAFHLKNTLIFFSSMLIFDLTTTAINNYMDYRKAKSDEYRKEKNVIGQEGIKESTVIATILTLFLMATGLGIWLSIETDLLVLLIGFICFCIGILYTFGPIPLSRMPLGEVFSGVTMGFGIVFLTVYVNAFDVGIAALTWEKEMIFLQVNLIKIIEIIIVSLPCMFTIANLMLANNICDVEEDIKNHRFTLPFYLGKKYSLWLYNGLYVGSFVAILISVFLHLLPIIALLSLVAILPVYKHMRIFNELQVKSKTFSLAVKNLIIVNGFLVVSLAMSFIIR
ncbi:MULTISPECIES: 1,4-dihydroxy-2-naphthoate polyprenyltransferase [Bacillaceae]|jgi:1,4-dihydroxy-2-naphthoate octaprenyltransferase|uniref:1,4-dihydroxy-2-naphthoate polyprenyltransferase n=1 Tax=Niallia hominis TaxID=3133173 RepID=A0ABV1F446_9BACI|nr:MULTISPECIES: 1,4-dihydroxy-2-naphthoate polyprenyltransferase [Bacillaceae]MCF2647158.1 1,4-dihydroxy-2-naphthoate polyprenyltransferase [Niallia circulans]MCM3361420.1 1,4-dihydroxy-2-naphthoate polyprenyltransferase [Niallia sp. MER TA 168]REB73967.1 1,4-dihydroxy-2-naphthoate polyprenyltransferase [Cutibacterium acnes]CAI9395823.1 1,4-dihydroxy-2-naphthoate octaprenyltransferase [Bacillus sp. T2.9-1]